MNNIINLEQIKLCPFLSKMSDKGLIAVSCINEKCILYNEKNKKCNINNLFDLLNNSD